MKQSEINKSYNALVRLSQMRLPIKTAFSVYQLVKKIEEPYKFALEEEKKLINKYNAEVKENGIISFSSAEDKNSFQNELQELNQLDHDIEIEPIVIKIEDLGEQTITPSDIFALEGFVEFEGD